MNMDIFWGIFQIVFPLTGPVVALTLLSPQFRELLKFKLVSPFHELFMPKDLRYWHRIIRKSKFKDEQKEARVQYQALLKKYKFKKANPEWKDAPDEWYETLIKHVTV